MKTNPIERTCLLLTRDAASWKTTADTFVAYGVQVEFADGLQTAQVALRSAAVAAVLLDGKSLGAETIALLRALVRANDAPVVVALDLADELDQIMALEMGAVDVISRNTSPRLLLARLSRLHVARRVAVQGACIHAGDLVMDTAARVARVGTIELPLTVSEFDVLHVLVTQRDRPVNRDEIAQHLGRADDGSRGADMTICRIRRKLREAGVASIRIRTAYGRGYTLMVDDTEVRAAAPVTGSDSELAASDAPRPPGVHEASAAPRSGWLELVSLAV